MHPVSFWPCGLSNTFAVKSWGINLSLTGKHLAALESSIFREHTIYPNTGSTSDTVSAGQKCLEVPRKASHDSSGISGHTAGSSGVLQSIPGAWHAVSALIGPHKEPHEENRNQDNGEVETQLPGGVFHSHGGSVRTGGRLLRAHQSLLLVLTS